MLDPMTDASPPPAPFRRIMACISLSPHAAATVREAMWLAGICGGELAFVHAGRGREGVERIVRQSLPSGLPASNADIVVRDGKPGRVILAEAARWGADLLFAGALASDPLLTGVRGSVARLLARNAGCSVYLSPRLVGVDRPLRTVVIAVEFREASHLAATLGVELARRASAQSVHLVHEYNAHAIGGSDSAGAWSDQAGFRRAFGSAQRFQLANAAEGLDLAGLSPTLACIEGRDLVQTTAYARDARADLLVLAAPPRRVGLLDRVVGEPTEAVLQRLPCSILLVRRPDRPGVPPR